jgi:uncharacterized repeat protein (TIGR03803 family)
MATQTTLESFTGGVDGGSPGYGSLLMDANGDLFGTTLSGGAYGGGTAFELVKTGSGYTMETLVSFDPNSTVNGNTPFAGLTMDASGNLYGVTSAGGAGGQGTVFELVNTGTGYSQQTLASFSGPNGASPTGTLLADANGDLFGTTQSGGASGQGTVFEMVHSASGYSLQTLFQFNYTDGSQPTGPLIADASGDLFGTTQSGGAGGSGTVFELVNTGSGYTLNTLESFDGSNGSYLYAGVVADAQGDLFGATYSGPGGNATVYELVHSGSGYTFETIATLAYGVNGGDVIGGLTIDAQGDIFGTAEVGGTGGFGTVFELVKGASGYTVQTVEAFSGANGAMPEAGVIVDASGNLYGTTLGGGASGGGTVFEIGSAAPTNEQANLALKVNGGSGSPIGVAGEHNVGFTVAGLQAGDTGVVTFIDSANHTVTVNVAAGQVQYTADFSTLTDGAISGSLQVATNSSGVSFTPVAGNVVTLDTTPPAQPATPTDASVSNGYVNAAENTAAQTIAGTAEAGSAVHIYDDGALVTSVIADGAGAWSYQVGALVDGAHSFAVTATDAAGNVSTMSAPLSFTVVTTPPATSAPSDAAVVNGYVNAAHDTAAQSIGGTTEAGASVVIYDNGTQVGLATADGAGAWTYQVGALANGSSHSYAVTATDAAGNTSAMSQALSFTVDTSAPAKPSAPTDAAVSNGYVNAAHDTAVQTISGTTEAGATVSIYDNGTQVGLATADGGGAWTYQVGALANGSSHSYAVTATDAAGNTSAFSQALSFTVDTVPPASAVAGVTIGSGGVATVSGSAEAGSTVTLYDGGKVVSSVTAGAGGTWSDPVGVLAAGSSHSYTVTATDAAGNTSAVSSALTYTAPSVQTLPPTTPTTPTPVLDNVTSTSKGLSIVSGTCAVGSTVTLYDGGQQVGSATTGSDGTWSVTLKLNGGATHQFTETAVDLAGHAGASTGSGYWANPANKSFSGGTGDDVFIGQKGDTFTAGAGHDHFVFNTGFGKETISGFASGTDQIWFDHTLFGSAAAVMANALRVGGDTLISDGAGDQLLLQGVLPTGLHAGDFHFF